MGDLLDTPIEELNLSVRAYNCLRRSGLTTIGQLLPLGEADFLALHNLGRKAYEEIMARLAERGFGGTTSGPGPDEPDKPDGPDLFGDGVPRRPSPGGLATAAEAIPEPDVYQVDARGTSV